MISTTLMCVWKVMRLKEDTVSSDLAQRLETDEAAALSLSTYEKL